MMQDKIINGREYATEIRSQIKTHLENCLLSENIQPGLAIVMAGDHPASEVYVRNKVLKTQEVGMLSVKHKVDHNISEANLLKLINKLNNDVRIHGIIIQLPLPEHIDEKAVINAIDPKKDVDGFTASNMGLLSLGQTSLIPCTPLGCLKLLRRRHNTLSGLNAVVVGRSNIVGKPMASLLLRENCTVTVAHSQTQELDSVCSRADILVAAVGSPSFIQGSWIKAGASVIDVGINRVPAPELGEGKSRLVGDVDFDAAIKVCGGITPVPGGVGPMTIACLLTNTLMACCRSNGISIPPELSVET